MPKRFPRKNGEQMRETDELDPNATYPAVDEDSITFSTTPDGQAIGAEDYIVNILLIGQDRRERRPRSFRLHDFSEL